METVDKEPVETNWSLNEPKNCEKAKVPRGLIWMVFRHADWNDIVLMGLGTCGCFVDGLSVSAMMLVMSYLMNGYASVSSLTLEDVNQVSSL